MQSVYVQTCSGSDILLLKAWDHPQCADSGNNWPSVVSFLSSSLTSKTRPVSKGRSSTFARAGSVCTIWGGGSDVLPEPWRLSSDMDTTFPNLFPSMPSRRPPSTIRVYTYLMIAPGVQKHVALVCTLPLHQQGWGASGLLLPRHSVRDATLNPLAEIGSSAVSRMSKLDGQGWMEQKEGALLVLTADAESGPSGPSIKVSWSRDRCWQMFCAFGFFSSRS